MRTIGLLFLSNIFMTFAWYGHLKTLRDKPLMVAVLVSWGIAFFEYLLQVPANRLGYGAFTLSQLKITQEIITMVVFAGFAVFYMRKTLSLDFLYAGICLVAAAYFIFRGSDTAG
ncbi:MAG TPA: DMT family protein [bacterium]|nr:DMT family protein [bacterium]